MEINEELCKKAAAFFDECPEKLKEAEAWYSSHNFETPKEALKHSAETGYWIGCLFVAHSQYLLDCYIALAESIKAGTFRLPEPKPADQIIEIALEQAKGQEGYWDDPAFVFATDAIKMADNRISPSKLSKLLSRGKIPVRFVRKNNRCKIHQGDWKALIDSASALGVDTFSDEAFEAYHAYQAGIQNRLRQERAKKTNHP